MFSCVALSLRSPWAVWAQERPDNGYPRFGASSWREYFEPLHEPLGSYGEAQGAGGGVAVELRDGGNWKAQCAILDGVGGREVGRRWRPEGM